MDAVIPSTARLDGNSPVYVDICSDGHGPPKHALARFAIGVKADEVRFEYGRLDEKPRDVEDEDEELEDWLDVEELEKD